MSHYSKKKITQACSLYDAGVPLRAIMKKTGIKSTSTIQYRCDPAYRLKHDRNGRKWRKANPERWAEICRKARERGARRKKK